MPITLAAREVALSPLDDDAACAQLRARLANDPGGLSSALELIGARDNFLDDRAYRLLSAVAEDRPVRPIFPSLRHAFHEEETFGRLPLREAYARLAEREPRLGQLANEAASHTAPSDHREALHGLIGITAKRDDALLRSDVALSIASQYLAIVGGDEPDGDLEASFFDDPRIQVRSSALLGRKRPTAQN